MGDNHFHLESRLARTSFKGKFFKITSTLLSLAKSTSLYLKIMGIEISELVSLAAVLFRHFSHFSKRNSQGYVKHGIACVMVQVALFPAQAICSRIVYDFT